eukprot:2635079-Prorocentrum_lima.AAC.1
MAVAVFPSPVWASLSVFYVGTCRGIIIAITIDNVNAGKSRQGNTTSCCQHWMSSSNLLDQLH